MKTSTPEKAAPTRKGKDAHAVLTDRILAALDAGEVPWRKPWNAEAPASMSTGKEYAGAVNRLVLSAECSASKWWGTFREIKKRGGSVRKGERGSEVFFWSRIQRTQEAARAGETDAERAAREKAGKPFFMLRFYVVFNAEQCAWPEGSKRPVEPEPRKHAPLKEAEDLAAGYFGGPKVVHGGGRACYSPGNDEVRMPKPEAFHAGEHYYSALFHELAHSTGHDARLGRGLTCSALSLSYAVEELTAELAACLLRAECGILEGPPLENSVAYLQGWRKALAGDKRMLATAASRAGKAAAWVLGKRA